MKTQHRTVFGVVVLLCCLAVLAGCGRKEPEENAGTPSKVLVMDEAGFDSQIAHGVILVDFWAPWCGPCKIQGPIVEIVANRLQNQAIVAKLNVDDAPKASEKFSIKAIPTLIVFKEGKAVKQFTGVTDADTLISAVNAALKQ
jgi:thioredoxin 1